MLEGAQFGSSGEEIVIEEFMEGRETSLHLLVSGQDFSVLPTSRDHKKIGEGDTGPNTGVWVSLLLTLQSQMKYFMKF